MTDLYNRLREATDEELLTMWRRRFKDRKAYLYVVINQKNKQVDSEEEGFKTVKDLADNGVSSTLMYYSPSAPKYERWFEVK